MNHLTLFEEAIKILIKHEEFDILDKFIENKIYTSDMFHYYLSKKDFKKAEMCKDCVEKVKADNIKAARFLSKINKLDLKSDNVFVNEFIHARYEIETVSIIKSVEEFNKVKTTKIHESSLFLALENKNEVLANLFIEKEIGVYYINDETGCDCLKMAVSNNLETIALRLVKYCKLTFNKKKVILLYLQLWKKICKR